MFIFVYSTNQVKGTRLLSGRGQMQITRKPETRFGSKFKVTSCCEMQKSSTKSPLPKQSLKGLLFEA